MKNVIRSFLATIVAFVEVMARSTKVAKTMAVMAAIALPIGLIADGISIFSGTMAGSGSPGVGSTADLTMTLKSDQKNWPNAEKLPELSSMINVSYMRTFGALRTTALMTAIGEGGFTDVDESGGTLRESKNKICCGLPKFYQKWEFRNIRPLANPLWTQISSIGNGYDVFLKAAIPAPTPELAEECYVSIMEAPGAKDESFPFECDSAVEKQVGFLFLILKGIQPNLDRETKIAYIQVQPDQAAFDWSNYSLDRANRICGNVDFRKTTSVVGNHIVSIKSLPPIDRGQSYLWPVAAYKVVGNDKFRGMLIGSAYVPLCVHSTQTKRLTIRPPGREAAITVPLPDGWYWQ